MTTEVQEFVPAEWSVLFPGDEEGLYSGTYPVWDAGDTEPVADVTPDRIARVDGFFDEFNWSDGRTVVVLAELTDGTWAACMAWHDTTGWDCRGGVQWKWAPTRDEVIRQGLDRESRELLGLDLPEDAS